MSDTAQTAPSRRRAARFASGQSWTDADRRAEPAGERSEGQVVYFALDLTLADIPAPGVCDYCGAAVQKEFLDYQTATPSLWLYADPTPGYGCTGCGLKSYPEEVAVRLLEAAAAAARNAHDNAGAERLVAEAGSLKQISSQSAG